LIQINIMFSSNC